MRAKIILLLGLFTTASTLLAGPALERKPSDPFFDNFHPLKGPKASGLFLKKGDRLAICGDSITEQKMYCRIMEDYLTMCVPQLDVTVRQVGWSGEQAPGFLSRMTNDCLRFNPTIATTFYGMNDFQYKRYQDDIGAAYRKNTTAIVDGFKAHGVRVVLGAPGCVGMVPKWSRDPEATVENLNLSLCELRNLDAVIASEENVRFADVFWPMLVDGFTARQKYGESYGLNGADGVHPHWAGHTLIAYEFLKAMGLDGNIGTFTVDLKSDKIKVTAGHKVISAKAGEYEIESSRYPFCPCEPEAMVAKSYPTCGKDDVSSDNSIRSGMTLVPFEADLNRLMLVVKNADAKQYQVTWGDQKKTFTGDQLKKGINLAEEFPQNPFSEAFARVDAAVAAKEAFETKEIKTMFRPANPHYTHADLVVQTEKVLPEAEAEHQTLQAAVASAFVPVTHTIRIVEE